MKKKLFLVGILSIIILLPLVVGAETVKITNPLQCKTEDNCVMEIIAAITGILQVLAIAVGVIMIILAGIQYMTSAGSEEKTKKAKNMILYALIGIAIITSVNFIIGLLKEILGKTN